LLEQVSLLDQKMTPVEEQLIQVNMKGSEANLAFPNMLNEQFDTFSSSVQGADGAPTQQQYEVFQKLRTRLNQQLTAWKEILSTEVPAFNTRVREADLPALALTPGNAGLGTNAQETTR